MNSLKTQRMAGRARATIATVAATALALSPINMRAGDLNTEVNNMFNSLGAIGNYTAPGAFRGQTFNTYTGGSLFMRAPNKVYQLAAIQFPSAKAGCGGIDVFGGSFSHISAAEFKNMLRNITAALPGIAFQLQHNGRTLLHLAAGDAARRVADVLGEEFAAQSRAVDAAAGSLHLAGYAALPAYSRARADAQYFFVKYG